MYIVVGLGNPGKEYEHTRHNAGRMVTQMLKEKTLEGVKVITPDTYMNDTGRFVRKFVRNESEAEQLVVISDDIDSPLGSLKIVFDRGSGGHRGLESIEEHLGTKKFIKVKIGILPKNIFGKPKKPKGEEKVQKFILSDFKHAEMEELKPVYTRAVDAIETIAREGLAAAQNKFNTK